MAREVHEQGAHGHRRSLPGVLLGTESCQREGCYEALRHPVPYSIDNGFTIWDSYKTRYWPTLLLIDKRGVVRYAHVGEGAYDLTEQTILGLLGE
jgi:hypothetical protein